MPTAWTNLMDLKPTSFRANLKLRLIRSYDLRSWCNSGENYARECILHDHEGNRVIAIIQKDEMPLFGPALQEGKLYRISNPYLIANNKPILASYKNKLSLTKRTTVAETYDNYFPEYLFQFKPFGEIMAIPDSENTPMFDVIGELLLDEPPKTKPVNGQETQIMDIYLENIEGERLECTLWGEYATQLMKYVQTRPQKPLIAVVQFCKAGKYNGTNKASTYFNVSKLYLDAPLPETISFKERYLATRSIPNEELSLNISSMTSLDSPLTIRLRTIEDIMERKEAGRFWICCSIAGYENYNSWYYTSCKGCPRKKNPSDSSVACVCKGEGIVLRYRLKVQVVDDTGILCLMLWDKHCIRMFGKKAEEMLKRNEHRADLPIEMEDLLERKVMFEIEVSKTQASLYEDTFSVTQVSMDRNFIEKYSVQGPDTQDLVSLAKKQSFQNQEGSSSSSLPLEEAKNSKRDAVVDLKEENKISSVKRDLLEDFETSSTENLKRQKVAVKLEKI